MNFFVAVTDYDWFQLHASKSRIEEVNFWRPSSEATFKALKTGELFLFKLHSPRNFIVGGGIFYSLRSVAAVARMGVLRRRQWSSIAVGNAH